MKNNTETIATIKPTPAYLPGRYHVSVELRWRGMGITRGMFFSPPMDTVKAAREWAKARKLNARVAV